MNELIQTLLLDPTVASQFAAADTLADAAQRLFEAAVHAGFSIGRDAIDALLSADPGLPQAPSADEMFTPICRKSRRTTTPLFEDFEPLLG